MTPKRVLFVLDTLDFGGTETQTVQVAQRLKAAGHQMTVACLHPGGPLTENLLNAGIRIVPFSTHGSLLSPRNIWQLVRLALFIRREQFDVVHSHDLWANLTGVPAARLAGTALVFSSQRDLAHLWWYTPLRTKVIRLIHRMSTKVIANSDAVRDHVVNAFLIPLRRVCVIRNGVDVARFANTHASREQLFPGVRRQDKLVAVVANMHSDVKGHHDIVEAAKEVCRVMPQVKFVLIGDGEERPRISDHVRQLHLEENFLFLGRRQDVPDLLSCCDLFLLASRAEGFPNVVLEAMAAGLPVVATAVGGVVEIVEDGRSGLIVPPQCPQEMAKAIVRILSDPELGLRLAEAGQEQVRRQFSFERVVQELQAVYRSSH
jgi:glycosyltransferase involved in cell wall biosynthesis